MTPPVKPSPRRSRKQGKAADARARAAVFTIVSANYIAYAATLMQSVRRFHPETRRIIVLSDAAHPFDGLDLAAEIITCDELGIALIENMKLWYSVIEFNTAVKPFVFRHLFRNESVQQAVYLDPDIQLFAPLRLVFEALAENSLVLTPHMTKPLQDGKQPSDLSIMKSGVYNLGFAALGNDEDANALVDWWCDRLFAHCRVDVAGNLFTDQRWMDLAPAFVPRTFLLRHPGYNVAYWNLAHRRVEPAGQGYTVDGQELVFFHFSGIVPTDPSVFSKHQNRFTIATLGAVAGLCEDYRAQVLANGWLTFNGIPYAFGHFRDGRRIADVMRRAVLRALDEGRLAGGEKLHLGARYFDAPEPDQARGLVSRTAYQFWLDRIDLRAAFNLAQPDGARGFADWFCNGPAALEGVDPADIAAVRRLRDASASIPAPLPDPVAPPWPPLASDAWAGPASEAAEWLAGDVLCRVGHEPVLVPREAALLWELRLDLQQFFPLRSRDEIEAYVAWAVTEGMREASIHAGLFSAAFTGWFSSVSGISRQYGDVPITLGMILTRKSARRREGFATWTRFPVERRARLEQGLWFAFLAPAEFRWPASLVAGVRAYFDQPSNLGVTGFPFSLGMLALWEIRDDLQSEFDLGDEPSRWRYLTWLLFRGLAEHRLDRTEFCPGLAQFLASPWPGHDGLGRLAELAYGDRLDLRQSFDVSDAAGRTGLAGWLRNDPEGFAARLAGTAPPAPAEPEPVRAAVALSGDWSEPSGIGEDLRCSAAAFDAVRFAGYLVVDMRTGAVQRPDGSLLPLGALIRVDCNIVHHNADTAKADWHRLQELRIEARRTIGHWAWELERLPSRAAHAFSFYDEIWANTRFAMQAFEAEARRPVRLLSGAVLAPDPLSFATRQSLGLDPDRFVFLFMFDFASYVARKNPQAVIRAFALAFPGGDEPVQLFIKTHNAQRRPDLWAELTGMTDDPRVSFVDQRYSRDQITALVSLCDAFVSLHRSEGYGRGPLEAMLLGRPVIMTGYSGTNDYADETTARLVDYTLVPVGRDQYPGVEQQRWAEPDVKDAASHMRWVFNSPDAAKAMAARAKLRISQRLSLDKVGAAMLAALGLQGDASPAMPANQSHLAPEPISSDVG